ncbi:hypothetical protein FRB90_010342 [Tulasnella sp. 427]|nr:hypothetical protein FRB90_010342 [Tulasnella sp. 427]
MYAAAPGICPRLIAFGGDEESKQKPYMISEYKEFSSLSSTSGKILARRMALELHEPKNSEAGAKGKFGFQWPTYCGATRLENGWFDTWDEAYGSLIKTLLDNLRQEGRTYSEICDLGDQVVAKYAKKVFLFSAVKLTSLFGPRILQSGNAGTLSSGEPIIFDPASYYGHNEADLPTCHVNVDSSLSIARIFGGFGAPFFEEYHKHRPKSQPVEEYEERVALYELFHYLNHTVLFGTGYAPPSISRMRRLLKFVEGKT